MCRDADDDFHQHQSNVQQLDFYLRILIIDIVKPTVVVRCNDSRDARGAHCRGYG